MKSFDLLQAPLEGVQLIEAGAGTGKTFNIAGLFLRLILEKGFAVDEILVVTYTKAATEELKRRIRRRLISAKTALNTGESDQLIDAMVNRGGTPEAALQRILDALTDFDRAAIFTIHGFCQRILNHFAFETGYLFEAQLLQDDQPLIQEMADDFWRRHIATAPEELAGAALVDLNGPEALAALFGRCRTPGMRVIPEAAEPPLDAIDAWREAALHVCRAWPAARGEALKLLASEGLNARWYGKCAPDKADSELSPRKTMLTALSAQMDQWEGRYPVFKLFDRFTVSLLEKATKKKHTTPRHPFFELCEHAQKTLEEMEIQISDYLRYLKVRLIKEARQSLDKKKRDQSLLFYDDLLLQVHGALESRSAPGLVRALRESYRAALVDEFQDTDALQYDIFTLLFGDPSALLFMIGDPKQAIYSFRGADLFSYLEAKRETSHQFTLTRNWRATQPLIQAINTLFGSHPLPFGDDQIAYLPAEAADIGEGPVDEAPFELWYLGSGEEEGPIRPISQEDATRQIVAAVAEQIVTLLNGTEERCPFEPQDIAVLTRTHRQAQSVKTALDQRGVTAVLHSAGSVFDTWEAASLALVLEAVAMPTDPSRVRTALATDLICTSAAELCASVEAPGAAWEARLSRFDAYHRIWQREGFYPMFSRLMDDEKIKSRLLAQGEGERRLTNILHLAELLHMASLERSSGPEGLLTWFHNQRSDGGGGEDAQKLRLESDARAVQIITIHKSKGLQFDVVFCPFVWSGARVDKKSITFHDPDAGGLLTMAIGPEIEPAHSDMALREALAENIRLLYVAVTRARQRCYLAWGRIKGTDVSATAYLFHGPPESDLTGEGLRELKRKMAGMDDARLIEELTHIEARSEGTIRLKPLPVPTKVDHRAIETGKAALAERGFNKAFDTQWRIASFSSLTAGAAAHEIDPADRDAQYIESVSGDLQESKALDLFAFPKGARAGLFFHDLIEHVDFANSDGALRSALVAEKLKAHGYGDEWKGAVEGMLARLGSVSLTAGHMEKSFCLSDVPWRKRINEMEFHYPIKPITPETIVRLFQEHGRPFVKQMPSQHWRRLNFSPVHGFMKGFIDMIFEYNGRYYLVDWKSNHLGNAYEDYQSTVIEAAMGDSFYYLQYHLYTVALDRWLQSRVEGYRYDRHFGGVFYLFIRGIDQPGRDCGIFYDLPEPEMVTSLRETLLGV